MSETNQKLEGYLLRGGEAALNRIMATPLRPHTPLNGKPLEFVALDRRLLVADILVEKKGAPSSPTFT